MCVCVCVCVCVICMCLCVRKEGNVLFNDALTTLYLFYMVSDIW